MISAVERRRFHWFMAALIALMALPLIAMSPALPLGFGASFALSSLGTLGIPVWVWWGMKWVRRGRSNESAAAEVARPRFWLPDRYIPLLNISTLILLGFFKIVVKSGSPLSERLLMFTLVWVPLAGLMGWATGRLAIYNREYWMSRRK